MDKDCIDYEGIDNTIESLRHLKKRKFVYSIGESIEILIKINKNEKREINK